MNHANRSHRIRLVFAKADLLAGFALMEEAKKAYRSGERGYARSQLEAARRAIYEGRRLFAG